MKNTVLTTTLLVLLCISCNTKKQKKATATPPKTAAQKAPITKTEKLVTTYTIESNSFNSIRVGSEIKNIPHHLISKKTSKTGEGDFTNYTIFDKATKTVLGYFASEPLNKSLVGTIIVTSKKAQTKEGIKIGMSYKELKSILKNYAAHGSEVESKTYINHGNLSYILDFPSNKYKMDKNTIPPSSKIVQININRILKRVNN